MREIEEKCGVFGIWSGDLDAAHVAYYGLFALQHRGQGASGIATSDGDMTHLHKGLGLMTSVFSEGDIEKLPGPNAIGHNRYATSGGTSAIHAQPILSEENFGIVHNGNIPSVVALEQFLSKRNINFSGHNDTELMLDAIASEKRRGATIEEAIRDCYPLFTGAFSSIILAEGKVIALRDPFGIRPLSIGTLNGAYVVASETCALDTIHAKYDSDVNPGEMVVLSERGLERHEIVKGQQKIDIFEFIYFARPDSIILGQRVYGVRERFGRQLWSEQPVKADVVIAIPDSAIPAALGYSKASGIPFEEAYVKNRYIGRTFIEAEQHLRDKGVALKLNLMEEVVSGKRVVLIDDSIVRGTTMGKLGRDLRSAGAAEVHVRIPCPPYRFPDFYGVDTADQNQLIAAKMSIPDMCKALGLDSLGFLSLEGTIAATGLPPDVFCTANFTGIYPIDIRERANEVSKVIFES